MDCYAAGGLVGLQQFNLRFQRRHRDGHVGRVRGDAGVACAEDRVYAVDALKCRATDPRRSICLPLCCGVVQIQRRVRCGDCLRWKLCFVVGPRRRKAVHPLGGVARAHWRDQPQPQSTVCATIRMPPSGKYGTRLKGDRLISTRCVRLLDIELHQVQKFGAAADEFRVHSQQRRSSFAGVSGPLVRESTHLDTLDNIENSSDEMLGYAPQRQMLPLMRSGISASDRSDVLLR